MEWSGTGTIRWTDTTIEITNGANRRICQLDYPGQIYYSNSTDPCRWGIALPGELDWVRDIEFLGTDLINESDGEEAVTDTKTGEEDFTDEKNEELDVFLKKFETKEAV